MQRPLGGLVLWFACATRLYALHFHRYHTQEEINAFLTETAKSHPDVVRFRHLGYSLQGRDINYVVISKGDPDNLPAIYLNGTHHGDEKSSTESVLGLIDFLVKNRRM